VAGLDRFVLGAQMVANLSTDFRRAARRRDAIVSLEGSTRRVRTPTVYHVGSPRTDQAGALPAPDDPGARR
jgi:hypothetical protein